MTDVNARSAGGWDIWYMVRSGRSGRIRYTGRDYERTLKIARRLAARRSNRVLGASLWSAPSERGSFAQFSHVGDVQFNEGVHLEPSPHTPEFGLMVGREVFKGQAALRYRCLMCSATILMAA